VNVVAPFAGGQSLPLIPQSTPFAVPLSAATIEAHPYIWTDPTAIPLRPWVYGRMWQRSCVGLVVAPGATGKTAMLVGHALALATGRPLLGLPVWGGPQRVWLWNLEDTKEELTRLVQAAAKLHDVTKSDLDGQLFLNSGLDGSGLVITEANGKGFVIRRPVVDALITELKAKQIDVLIVDPFVSCHSVPENDNSSIDMVAKEWARVAHAANCAVVLAHHTSKLGDGPVTAEKARGASALVAAARSAVALNRMSEAEAEKFGIPAEKAGRYIKAYDDKPNRAPRASECTWYHLRSMPLNNGGLLGGDEIPAVERWYPPSSSMEFEDHHVALVQSAVAAGDWRESNQSPDWVGNALATALGLDLEEPGEKTRATRMVKGLIKQGVLTVEEAKDNRGVLRKFVRVCASAGSSPLLHPEVESE
jgi:hypothetical protein